MELTRPSIKAVQWTGGNVAEMRKFLGDNVAIADGYLAVIQLRDDGTAKAILAKPPYIKHEPTGEFTYVGTGVFKDYPTGNYDVNGIPEMEPRETMRQEPVLEDVHVPGEWVVKDGDLISVKADLTLREMFPDLEG